MEHAESQSLQDLSDDELARSRRELVREYDRALRTWAPDRAQVESIWSEFMAIADEQQDREPVYLPRYSPDWL